jgi:Carboxypeptidase regulatory-like domain/TonB-dependent Receptor Plug Domain
VKLPTPVFPVAVLLSPRPPARLAFRAAIAAAVAPGRRLAALATALLCALPWAAPAARAQGDSAVISGVVQNAANGEPIVRAQVTVYAGAGTTSPRASSFTDDRGRFRFVDLPVGTLSVRVRALGYLAKSVTTTLVDGTPASLTIALTAVPVRLAPVQSEARARERERFESVPEVGALTVNGKAMAEVPSIGETDVLRAVQLLPGVIARNDYDAGYSVRGGESDQNLVLLDGIPVYNPFHLGGLFGTFLDEEVQDVNLLTGGFASEYGGRLSSVLDVKSSAEARRGVHGTAEASLLASHVALGGSLPDNKTSWNIAGRRTYADKIAGLFTSTPLPYHFQDAQAHLLRELPRGGELSLTAYAGDDFLTGTFAQFQPDSENVGGGNFEFGWGNRLVGMTWDQPLGPGAHIPLGNRQLISLGDSAQFLMRASYTQFATTLNLGAGSYVLHNHVQEVHSHTALTWFQDAHSRTLGAEVDQHRLVYEIGSPQAGTDIFRLTQNPLSEAVWYDDAWRTGDRLLMRFGLRGEHVTGTTWYGISPRGAVRYFLNRDVAITAAGGQYAQWIHAVRNEDTPIRIFDFWVSADNYVKVSTAQHAVLGAERWFGETRFVRVEGYYKRYHNVPEPNPADDPTVRGDEFNLLEGASYGLDVLVKELGSGPLSGWLAYSYAFSDRVRGDFRFPPAQDRRHNLNLVATYRTTRGYVFGARFGYGSGLPYTDIVGQIVRRSYDPSTNTWTTNGGGVDQSIEPVGGDRNGARYPGFQRLDLSVQRHWIHGRTTWTPYFSVVNAYNKRNVFIYSFDYTANPPTREATSQFPILPTVGLSVEW